MDRARKRELRALNDRVWNGEKGLFPLSSSLDSTLKKNTALIRRLRTAVSPATLNAILQDIRTLSLHKYLSEVISACYEGLCKLKSPGEIEAGVEIVSALHQRFGPLEFTESLGWLLGKGLATPDKSMLKALASEIREKEEKERIVRQRVLLRVVTELWLVGVLRTLDDVSRPDDATKGAAVKPGDVKPKINSSQKDGTADPFPLEVLKDLLGHDREHVNLPLLVIFVKAFSWDVLGVRPAEGRKTVEEDGETKSTNGTNDVDVSVIPGDDQPLTPPELQERFKNVVKRYFEDLKAHLVRDQKSIHNQARRNAEVYVKAGEVFDDRQANYEKQVKAQERLVANAQIIADAVGAEMPNLKDADESLSASNGAIGLVKAGEYLRNMGDGAGIWEDEEERRFYENIIDLKGKVPPILLEDGKKKKGEADDQTTKKADAADSVDTAKTVDPAEDLSTSIANKTIGAQVDVILARLPDLNTKDAVDQMAVDFCFLNSKASRNRLIKALTDVPKGRSDLLPAWSRLAATLGKYMPDIPKALVDYLDAEFRSLQRRKEKEFLGQVRLSNIRYLAELTKFGVVPEHVVFHCLKVAIDDFSRMNIEIICNLLENCGRYLLRNADTSPRMATFLETLQRKKSVQHIGQQERMLIENAIYYVDPPSRPAIEQKERTPLDLFVRKLLYVDLTKRNYSKILKQIRRLHWEEVEVVAVLEKVFSRPGKIKYGNIHLLAVLLGALYRYHPDFVARVVDKVVESINYGLEQNDFKFYQRRLAEVKYLSELYNYRMIEHPVIFDTIYKIATFGYDGLPVPGRINRFDMPDDFFRIRLIATVLETCGVFFSRGAAGKKLDSFLSFFQYYVYTKLLLPMDIEFIVQDTFALTRPQWKLATNLEEAAQALQLAIAQDKKTAGLDRAQEGDDGSAATSSGDENMEPDMPDAEMDAEDSSASEDEEAEDVTNSDAERSISSEEKIVVTRPEEEVDLDDEAEFQREYAKMMAESMESRKFERKPLFDLALPVRAKHKDAAASTDAGDGGAPSPVGTMSFALLTKKGNRQQTRKVEVPSDSTFAVAMMNQQQAEREEQQRIKNLVLNYDLRESEDPDGKRKLLGCHPLNLSTCIDESPSSGSEKPASYHMNRMERPVKERGGQRSRKLQLSDVDWT